MSMPDAPSGQFRLRAALATALLALAALLPQLGVSPLSDPSEARYAEAAREMLASGDYITPRLNGLNHFTKPPLTYWLAAASYKLCGGPGEFAARLPVALAAAAVVALTALIGIELLGSAGAWSGFLLLGSAGFLVTARLLLTDMFLTLAVVLFYWVLSRRLRDGNPLTRGDRLFIAAAAFTGFMAKGPIFLLWTLLPLAFLAWGRPAWRPLIRRSLGWPYLAGLCATAWWFIAAMLSHQGLWRYFLLNQSMRAMVSARDFHPGPPTFYLPLLLATAVCFLWPLLRFLSRRAESPPGVALLICWILPPLLLLSLIPAKHETYILPLLPALAVLGAGGLALLPAWGRRSCLSAAAALMLAAQLLLFLLFVLPPEHHPRIAALQRRMEQKYLRASVQRVAAVAGDDGTVVLFEHFTPSFFFYQRRPVLLVNPTIAGRFVNDEPTPRLRFDEVDARDDKDDAHGGKDDAREEREDARSDSDDAVDQIWRDTPKPVVVFFREQFMAFAARHPEAEIACEDNRFITLVPKPGVPRRRGEEIPAPPENQP